MIDKGSKTAPDKLNNKKIQASSYKADALKGGEAMASINTDVSTAVSSNQMNQSKKGTPKKDIESLEASKKSKKGKKGQVDDGSPEKQKKSHTFRGKNPYLCFKDEFFKTMLREPSCTGEKKSHKDVMVEIGQKWKDLTEQEKEKYKEMSKADQLARVESLKVNPPSSNGVSKPSSQKKGAALQKP